MRFRLSGAALHVHGCTEHSYVCDFFDHAPLWLVGNRDSARTQLSSYRQSVATRIQLLSATLAVIDAVLLRLEAIHK